MSSTILGGVRELEIVKKLARGESIKIVGAYRNHFRIKGVFRKSKPLKKICESSASTAPDPLLEHAPLAMVEPKFAEERSALGSTPCPIPCPKPYRTKEYTQNSEPTFPPIVAATCDPFYHPHEHGFHTIASHLNTCKKQHSNFSTRSDGNCKCDVSECLKPYRPASKEQMSFKLRT